LAEAPQSSVRRQSLSTKSRPQVSRYFPSVAEQQHVLSSDSGIYLIRIDESRGISVHHADRADSIPNDSIIAFALLCLVGLFLIGALATAVIFAIAL
jgi:hypothetical protein